MAAVMVWSSVGIRTVFASLRRCLCTPIQADREIGREGLPRLDLGVKSLVFSGGCVWGGECVWGDE